jgi:hypothetical protein
MLWLRPARWCERAFPIRRSGLVAYAFGNFDYPGVIDAAGQVVKNDLNLGAFFDNVEAVLREDTDQRDFFLDDE